MIKKEGIQNVPHVHQSLIHRHLLESPNRSQERKPGIQISERAGMDGVNGSASNVF